MSAEVRSVCGFCGVGCGVLVSAERGRITGVRGDPDHPANRGLLCTKGLALADRIPTGIVHINDQTVNDEANVPFGGVGASGTGARFGGAAANVEAFTETRWVTVRGDVPQYPF